MPDPDRDRLQHGGRPAPVAALVELARAHDAWLLTDDAHGLGLGSGEPVDLQMGTLSKAAGQLWRICLARCRSNRVSGEQARSLMFSTGLPPASVAAAAAALANHERRRVARAKPLENARRFTAALGREPCQSPIVPVISAMPPTALTASATLESDGYLVVAIRPPSVPPGTARLRFAFSAGHEPPSTSNRRRPFSRSVATRKASYFFLGWAFSVFSNNFVIELMGMSMLK